MAIKWKFKFIVFHVIVLRWCTFRKAATKMSSCQKIVERFVSTNLSKTGLFIFFNIKIEKFC